MDALITASTTFGPAEWVFFAAHIALVIAGIYLRFGYRPSAVVARRPLQMLSYGLIGLGAIGVLIGALRLAGIALPALLMTVVTILDLLLILFVVYFMRSVYPQAVATQSAVRGRPSRTAPPPRRVGSEPAAHSIEVDRGLGSGRRDSRRSQKRRKR